MHNADSQNYCCLISKAKVKKMSMNNESIVAFFKGLAAKLPHPHTELCYHSPYTLLVAVLLSAQTTDIQVNKATAPLFALADTPAAMVALGVETISETIRTLGLYRTKAKHIVSLSQLLVLEYGGEVPQHREGLEKLPGVGRKTANVVLNEAFGMPTLAVDTHVFRVANRTGLAKGKTVRQVEDQLLARVPAAYLPHAHHWLILHGRTTCKARKPLCGSCVVWEWCEQRTVDSRQSTER